MDKKLRLEEHCDIRYATVILDNAPVHCKIKKLSDEAGIFFNPILVFFGWQDVKMLFYEGLKYILSYLLIQHNIARLYYLLYA